jgi:hypothetical protein
VLAATTNSTTQLIKDNTMITTQPHFTTRIFSILVILLLATLAANAQWTTPDANGNINNTNTGKVGVGTTAPEFPLQVNNSSANILGLVYTGSLSGTSGAGIQSLTSTGPSAADQRLGFYTFGARSAGTSYNPIAIQGFSSQAWTLGTAQGGYLTFSTTPNGSATRMERMRIDQGGYIGMGTTAPGSPLTVIAPSGVREGIQVAGAGNTWIYTDFSMTPIGTIATGKPANFAWSLRKDAFYGNDSSGPSMVLEIARQGGGAYVPFIINPSGNVILAGANNATNGFVGIGTTAPAFKLDVSGSINTNNGLCLSGDCKTAWSQVGGSSQWTTSGSTISYNSGNVGVGNSAPGFKLDVSGSINATTGLCLNGDCKSAWSQIGGSSQWTTSGSTIYYNSGNVGLGTTAPGALFDLASSTQVSNRLLLSGQEFYAAGNSSTSGIAIRLGVNRTGERQIWFADSAQAINATNTLLRMRFYSTSASLDAIATDGSVARPLILQGLAGNVGIGTSAPAYTLDVNGGVNGFRAKAATASSGDAIASFDNTAGSQMIVRGDGNVGIGITSPTSKLHVNGSITIENGNINAKYQDVAEWVESSQQLVAGTVVVLDENRNNQVIASTQSYDSRVAGVISLQPGIALGEHGEGRVLVATTGRVKVKVDATNGPIKIGDLLVTSDKEGFAMKSLPVEFSGVRMHRPGTLIGKALEPLASGTGEILVLLSLQ